MNRDRVADLVLRAGVAFAFLYPPISAFVDPNAWIGYFPKFLLGFVPDPVLLHGFGSIEVIIALWILSGKRIFIPACIAMLMLVAITVFNLTSFQVVFRDLSIAAMALALAILHMPHKRAL
ncbi:hypothetical protein HZC00_02430 [Candidatus Kaiserbacteria bacterium]|nr:hypothetical protein [Candidatus Kaiserbacteria bacterium]